MFYYNEDKLQLVSKILYKNELVDELSITWMLGEFYEVEKMKQMGFGIPKLSIEAKQYAKIYRCVVEN